MICIVDSIECGWLTVEVSGEGDPVVFRMPSILAPSDIEEGDILTIVVSRDITGTASRRRGADDLLDGFFEG